jgi:hypothetical protein
MHTTKTTIADAVNAYTDAVAGKAANAATKINQPQYKALKKKIYDTLMSMPDMGMGEAWEAGDTAEHIIDEWMKENGLTLADKSKDNGTDTATTTKHTQGEAKVYAKYGGENAVSLTVGGKVIGDIYGSVGSDDTITPDEAKANAERLVKAWNNFDNVLRALNDLVDACREVGSLAAETKQYESAIAVIRKAQQ